MSKKEEMKGQNKFVATYLADAGKTPEQVAVEQVEMFVEDSIIACELVIDTLENQLKTNETKLKRAKNELSKAKATYEKCRFSSAKDFDQYINNLNSAKSAVSFAKQIVANWESEVTKVEEQLVEYKIVYADLTETL